MLYRVPTEIWPLSHIKMLGYSNASENGIRYLSPSKGAHIDCSVWPSSRSTVILIPTPEHLRVFLNCHFHNTFPRGISESKQLWLEAPKEKHYYDAWSISRTAKKKQNNGIAL